ncbi:hypothetical protein Ahy_A10g050593 [Arachis hypogaea]|uniref:DUF4283 domain-containing protein n=1 Tax=Arachis hypogaea TaxID=3818 RepID=A0A445B9T5_ARAHY|nr:hypothetical protein Ahy_A10g050593 [Arachis hypogaea]
MRGGGRATPFNPKPEVEVQRIWSKNGNVKVIDLTRDFFLVHFGNEGDYKHALFEGSWQVVDHYLRVPRDPPDAAMGDIVDNSKLTVPSSTQPLPNVLEQNSVV